MTVKVLIPVFPITGLDSYPTGVIKILEVLEYNNNDYYLAVTEDSTNITGAIDYDIYQCYDAKQKRITEIKKEAAARITATDWRLTRYSEQKALVEAGKLDTTSEDIDTIYEERQAIRLDSNTAEKAVNNLHTVSEVDMFSW